VPGITGSLLFALPFVVDPGLTGDGTLGLTLLDLLDHWAFRYALVTVGLMECLLVGWVLGADKLRAVVNRNSKFRLGPWFDWLIKLVIPAILVFVLVGTLWQDLTGGLYGSAYEIRGAEWLPVVIPLVWLVGTIVMAGVLTSRPTHASTDHHVPSV
jgi:neurotransmitter:Na+ symporter, NSS family